MRRYKLRTVLMMSLLAALLIFAFGASPALRNLEQQVSLQQTQLDLLQAEVDQLPLVLDASGALVGPVVGAETQSLPAHRAVVQLDLEGLPLFTVSVERGQIVVGSGSVFFESGDCTGDALALAGDDGRPNALWGTAIVIGDDSSRTFYVTDPSEQPVTVDLLSGLHSGGRCAPITITEGTVLAAAVDLDSMFVPPFRIVARGELAASP